MKIIWAFLFILLTFPSLTQGVPIPTGKLQVESGVVLFRSKAPMETIVGKGSLVSGYVDMGSKKVVIKIDLRDWKTGHSLKDRHLHDNYLETQKFPLSIFEGEIQNYDPNSGIAKVKGTISLHGKSRTVELTGTLNSENDEFVFTSEFSILLTDYGIPIPKLLILKLNEKIEVRTKFKLGKQL